MTQTSFDCATGYTPPLARSTDPATSRESASAIAPRLHRLHRLFVSVFDRALTAAEAAAICVERFGGIGDSYRKRAAECVRAKLLRVVGVRVCTVTGHSASVYERREA